MIDQPKRERRIEVSCWMAVAFFTLELLGAYKLGEIIVEAFQ